MAERLPRGVVTYLFSDVAGSTALWEEAAEAMGPAMARHDELVEAAVRGAGGLLVRPRGEGDSRFAVFVAARDAVEAAVRVQRALAAEHWPTPRPVTVRLALHTGEADLRDGDYYGRAVNRCARLRGLGHPGQVLLSQATAALVVDALPAGARLRELGAYALPDLLRPETVFQLCAPGLPDAFPALRSVPAERLEIGVLGPVEASRGDRPLDLGGPDRRAVLALLALQPGRTVTSAELRSAVLGAGAPAAALRTHVAGLRRALEPSSRPSVLTSRGAGYALQLPPGAVDLQRFEVIAADAAKELADGRFAPAARGFAAALALWRGAPLAGTPLAGSPAADRLAERRLAALEELYDAELGCGGSAALVAPLRALLDEHPQRQRLWGHLALALHRSGLHPEAVATLDRARRVLAGGPGPELRDLERRLHAQDPGLGGPPGAARQRVRLPVPSGPLLGREVALGEVCGLLADPTCRLLTVTGPGGAGKTRLAVEAATRLSAGRPGGTYLVPLAGVTDPELVLPAVAAELEVVPAPDEPLAAALAVSLDGRGVLLVLDNLEQVVAAAPAVADLLAGTRAVQVLATSRTALRLSTEREYPLPPLDLPTADACAPEQVAASGAGALFTARAAAARPGFVLDAEAAGDVAEICRRLDGLPLAIELAAARTALLTPSELLARLDSPLRLLVGGARDLPDRQRTLRATIDWSYALLEPASQRLLARLGVFGADFDLAAAEAVGGDGDVLPGLAELVASGLVARSVAGASGRFRLLESVREYAVERLRESGEQAEAQDRLAALLVAVVEAAHAGLDGPQAPRLLADLRARHTDLALVLDRADAATAARLAVGLRVFWLLEGRLGEGRLRLAQVLATPLPAGLRAQALLAAGVLAYFQDDAGQAAGQLGAAADLAGQVGDEHTVAVALGYLGATGLRDGRVEAAQEMAERALALALRLGSYEAHTLALSLTGVLAAVRGDLPAEREVYLRRLDLARGRADCRRIAETLNNLAEIALLEGDHLAARAAVEEAVDLARGVARLVTRDVQLTLARVELADGGLDRAADQVAGALRLSVDLGQEFEIAQCLLVAGAVAGAAGEHDRAAELYGAGSRLRGDRSPLELELEPDVARQRDRTRDALGVAAFAARASAGEQLPRDLAVALALAGAGAGAGGGGVGQPTR